MTITTANGDQYTFTGDNLVAADGRVIPFSSLGDQPGAVVNSDGSVTFGKPSEGTVTYHENGDLTMGYPDGTQVNVSTDGSMKIVMGSGSGTYEEGTVIDITLDSSDPAAPPSITVTEP